MGLGFPVFVIYVLYLFRILSIKTFAIVYISTMLFYYIMKTVFDIKKE